MVEQAQILACLQREYSHWWQYIYIAYLSYGRTSSDSGLLVKGVFSLLVVYLYSLLVIWQNKLRFWSACKGYVLPSGSIFISLTCHMVEQAQILVCLQREYSPQWQYIYIAYLSYGRTSSDSGLLAKGMFSLVVVYLYRLLVIWQNKLRFWPTCKGSILTSGSIFIQLTCHMVEQAQILVCWQRVCSHWWQSLSQSQPEHLQAFKKLVNSMFSFLLIIKSPPKILFYELDDYIFIWIELLLLQS